jgi:DNA-binding CsgD family transcriptional regulator/transcriptional regulator with GAF, ATPase, and Fis domain
MTSTKTSRTAPDRMSSLSARELEIAGLYADGKTYREISEELNISPTTVRNHVAAVYRKLDVRNKPALGSLLRDDREAPQGPGSVSAGDTPTERALKSIQAQQRAINDVLQVISHTPGDLDAIFDVILDYALQLSDSQLGIVYICVDGGFKATAFKNVPEDFQAYLQAGTIYPDPNTGLGRMAGQHRIIRIQDVRAEALYRTGDPLRVATADLGRARSFIAIPMIHRGALVGAFTIYRQQVEPFTDEELTLLQAFSNQAAIALTITQLIDGRDKLLKKLDIQQ